MSATLPPPPGRTILGYAGFWWRVLAWFVDSLILAVVDAVLGRLTGWRQLGTDPHGFAPGGDATVADVAYTQTWTRTTTVAFPSLHLHGGALSLASLAVAILYFSLFEASRWQATPGKRVCRMSVTDLSGARIGFGRALARYLSKFLSFFLLGIGFLMVAWTHRKQGLHDKIAGTLVLRRRAADTVFAFALPPG